MRWGSGCDRPAEGVAFDSPSALWLAETASTAFAGFDVAAASESYTSVVGASSVAFAGASSVQV